MIILLCEYITNKIDVDSVTIGFDDSYGSRDYYIGNNVKK